MKKALLTGAIGERKGYFGEADGGTIFLDEVGVASYAYTSSFASGA